MNEAMEFELAEMDSRTDNLAVTEEANFGEAIPIDIKTEQSTESYNETLSKVTEKILEPMK